jgi:uncharacterized protein
MAGLFSTRVSGGVAHGVFGLVFVWSGAATAQSFDCSRATPPIETAICASADLRAKDNALAGAYARALFALREDATKLDAIKQAQRAWIAGRNRACAADATKIETCLSAAYGERLAAIAQTVAATPAPAPQAAQAPVVAAPQAQPAPQVAQRPAPAPTSIAAPSGTPVPVQPASVPADRDASALVTIPAPGRYSIRTQSGSGVSVQLVDMIAGPGDVAGAGGARDGRLDLLLDKGVYKLRTSGAKGASGVANIRAEAFRDAAPPTQLAVGAPQSGDLGDMQQRAFWLDVDTSGQVAIEAVGRALQDLRLWRNGEELADVAPDILRIETKAGRPMTRVRLEGKVEPGRYLATAYGGESAIWPDGGADRPFMIRRLAPASLAAGVAEATIGPFGSARFSAPAAMDAFRLELAQPAPVRMIARRAALSTGVALAKNSRDVFAVATLAADGKEAATVEVSGLEGQAFRLRGLHQSNNQRVTGAGPTFVVVDVAGEGGDEIPATALLAKFDKDGKSRVIAADAPRIGAGQAWRGRFNLRGPSTLLFEMTSPGPVAIRTQGPAARVVVEPVLGAAQPRADGATPSLYNLEAGVYQLRITPVSNAAGAFDLTFGQPGQQPDRIPQPPARSAISFGQQQLERGATYQIVANSAPGLLVGVRTHSMPVDLAKGPVALWQGLPVASAPPVAPQTPAPAPAPAPQKQGAAPAPVKPASLASAPPKPVAPQAKPATPAAPKPPAVAQAPAPAPTPAPAPAAVAPAPSGDLTVQARAPLGGSISVRDQRGADVAFTLSDEQAQKDFRTFTLRIPASAVPRALGVAWRAAPPAPASAQQAARALETVPAGQPGYFDLAEGQRREFRLEAKEGGLYRIETLGRLNTSLSLGANFLPKIGEGADNGAGHNALVQTYLRAGSYRVAVSAKDSTGRAGLLATPAAMVATGVLSPDGSVRATLADGRGAVAPIEIPAAGNYRLDLYGLDRAFSARLEDSEGWPITAPGPLSRLDLKLEAGHYRLVVPPVDVESRMVARLRPVVAAPPLEGHGPHALRFGQEQKFQWREPAARDAPRTPDAWTFALAGEANVDLSIGEGMIGEIFRGEKDSVGKFTKQRPFAGALGAGAYRVEARALGRDDRLDYAIALSSDELQPDAPRYVRLPAKLDFTLAQDRVVNLTTFGRKDLKGVLRDANGAIVERIGGRNDDWNIALARRLGPGRYTLSLSAMTAEPTPEEADDSADDQPDEEAGEEAAAADAGPAAPEENQVEVRFALPKEIDNARLALDTAATAAGSQAARYLLPETPAGALAVVSARSAAELVLSIETRDADAAAWRVIGFERGQSPVVAWPAPSKPGAQWRATVWSIDGAAAPASILARAVTRQPQDSASVALDALPANESVPTKLRVGLARAPASAIVDLSAAEAGVYAGSSEGHALARADGGPLAPQSERLWFLTRDDSVQKVQAPALAWNGQQIALALDGGETAHLPSPPVASGTARIWRARSAFGRPGLDSSRGMAVAESFAAALDAGKGLRLWNAGGADALRVDLDSVDVALAPKAQGSVEFSTLLAPRTALPLALPAGDKKLEIDLGPDTAAFAAPGESDRLAIVATGAALARTVGSAATEIWLVNTSDRPQPARVTAAPGKPEAVTADRVAKRFFGAAGSTVQHVEAAKGDVLRVEGAEATFVAQSGRVLTGSSLTLDGPGDLTLDYQPGLVAAWIERAGVSAWPKAEARALAPPASTKLEGAAMAFALKADRPALVGVRSTAPVALAFEQNGRRELQLFAAGADFRRYLAAGDATLTVYSPHDGPLGGVLDVTQSPVTPAKDGLGDPVALSPGASVLFGFEVKRAGEIGVGVRAEPDRVEARVIDAAGKQVAQGLAQIVKLDPGRYFLEARVPVDAPATVVRPALVGLDPPPAGPPPDEVAKYLAAAGLKNDSKAR